jgi:C4-dicarboxylate-specific signal transduction histidine kinase
LEQVLLNLLRNAIEANREVHAGQQSLVYLRTALEDNAQHLCISVEDQGPGVTEEALARLFTPFYTSKSDGLGLGLSMSRSIIEGFGGELLAIRQTTGLMLACRLPIIRSDMAEQTTPDAPRLEQQ